MLLLMCYRDDEEEVVAQGIGKLYVSSRFAPRLLFDGCANTFFKGYGQYRYREILLLNVSLPYFFLQLSYGFLANVPTYFG